jgi:hypothetical protein
VVATEPKKRGRPSKGAEGSRPAGKKTEEERVNAAEAAILAALLASKGMDDDKRVDLIAKVAEKVAGDEDEEEAGDEDAKSVAFDPETAVAEDAEEEDAEEEPYFTVEINGKDVMVMKEDQGELKAGCVYELTTDDEGDVVPGKQIGTWKNDEFVPLPKKPTIVVGGKKA